MKHVISRLFIAVVLLLGANVPALADGCSLVRLASVEMNLEQGGRTSVPMTIAGKNFNMLVDTGGFLTMLSRSAAASLGLTEQRIVDDMVGYGVGGMKADHFVIAPSVDLGGLKATNFRLMIIPRTISDDAEGTIGPDILTKYDVEFDFANARFNLFSRQHCPGQVVYWTHDPFVALDLIMDRIGHISVPVMLDGKRQMALIDTGSWRSAMSLESAKSAYALKDSDLKGEGGSSDVAAQRYAFKTMTIQGITVNNPDIVLLPDSYAHLGRAGAPDLLLGAGILRQLHLYIAYGERKIYVTPASAH
jgi:predicted aspartyl protease